MHIIGIKLNMNNYSKQKDILLDKVITHLNTYLRIYIIVIYNILYIIHYI